MAKKGSSSVQVPATLRRFIDQRVKAGDYPTASDVVTTSLRLLRRCERDYGKWKKDARAAIEEGWQEAIRGELLDGPLAMTLLRRRLFRRPVSRA